MKCVTVKVPGNDLLQHVTLVDLPGSGDRNKSRDKMWKEVIYSHLLLLCIITVLPANCDIILLQSTDNYLFIITLLLCSFRLLRVVLLCGL